jgi:hypothetical protein
MSRGFLATLTAVCVAFAPCALMDLAQAATVKSSKSNTSDRMGGGGGHSPSAKDKSSESSNNERMGGGGGHGQSAKGKSSKPSPSEWMGGGGGVWGGGGGGPFGVINLNSSRSNKY